MHAKAVSYSWVLTMQGTRHAVRIAYQMALAVAAHHLRTPLGLQLPPERARWLQALPRWAERALAPLQRCC